MKVDDNIAKQQEVIDKFNEGLLKPDTKLYEGLELFDDRVLVTPFYADVLDRETGWAMPNFLRVPSASGERMISVPNPFPFQDIGVVTFVAEDAAKSRNIKVGDVVLFDIGYATNFAKQEFTLDRATPQSHVPDERTGLITTYLLSHGSLEENLKTLTVGLFARQIQGKVKDVKVLWGAYRRKPKALSKDGQPTSKGESSVILTSK